MQTRQATMVLAGLIAAWIAAGSWAQTTGAAPADDRVAARPAGPDAPGGAAAGAPADDDLPKFDEVTKDTEKLLTPDGGDSFFPMLINRKKDQVFLIVPKGMLNKNFLISTSIAAGNSAAGSMWGTRVVQWREIGKQLVLIEPDLRYTSGKGKEVEDVIARTYTDRIVLATPIATRRGPDPVINLDTVFKKDFAGAGGVFGGAMDAALSRWSKTKVFPNNIELGVDAAFMAGTSGTRAGLHYSIVKLPEGGDYKPREADERIGYFLTAVKDWTTPHDADTIFKRYIHRWNMPKSDPKQDVSDVQADHQLVYYIEKTVPVQYRRYVREGILAWNRAFEKAGIRNAVQVRQQTDDNEFASIDPEDVRYHFFRWIVTGQAFARGPSIVNPLTGEILDADIVFDDSFIRALEGQYARLSARGPAACGDAMVDEFLARHPEWNFKPSSERWLPDHTRYGGVDMSAATAALAAAGQASSSTASAFGGGGCDYAQGLMQEMAFDRALLDAAGQGGLGAEYVGQILREVVMHEVGHTLGLRHNFKASSWKPMSDIIANTDPNTPVYGSVMDYIGGQFALDKTQQGLFMQACVGPYDEWAIAYGYSIPDGTKFKDEKSLLKSITDRVAEPGLAYATDEDTSVFAPDPHVNRYDNGSDVLEYAKLRMDLVRKLQGNIMEWAVKDGESYFKARQTFDLLLNEYNRVAQYSARYVGGQFLNRDRKGDPNGRSPIVIVPAARQREALNFLRDNVLSDASFKFDPAVLNKLAPGRWDHWDSDAIDSQLDYPLMDRIAAIQHWALFYVLNPVTLGRVYDAEQKVAASEDAITVPELMDTVSKAVWAEIDTAPSGAYDVRKAYISPLRRSLQRAHLNMLINAVLQTPGQGTPADVSAVTYLTLENLKTRMDGVLKNGGSLDAFSRAHLEDSSNRIKKALEAEYRL